MNNETSAVINSVFVIATYFNDRKTNFQGVYYEFCGNMNFCV